ncbi:MAG: 3'(2'),5'-bisphosphate nucleotidase CysQ [Ginsengibacter sp.]
MNELLTLAIEASLHAGDEILAVYNREQSAESKRQVEYKADNSPLTEADLNANNVINAFLKQTSIPIISEENKEIPYSERSKWRECWIVDPLDGTKEFIKRNGEFTVNIALVKDQRPVLGVIYVPATGELYFGDVENKSSNKVIVNDRKNINLLLETASKISPATSGSDTIRIVGSRSHMNDETKDFIEEIQKKYKGIETISKGSSLKFCLVAEGKADVYPRFAPTMEWDTAAGQAICEAAGLKVISKETGKELLYNKSNLLNSFFLVTNNPGK